MKPIARDIIEEEVFLNLYPSIRHIHTFPLNDNDTHLIFNGSDCYLYTWAGNMMPSRVFEYIGNSLVEAVAFIDKLNRVNNWETDQLDQRKQASHFYTIISEIRAANLKL